MPRPRRLPNIALYAAAAVVALLPLAAHAVADLTPAQEQLLRQAARGFANKDYLPAASALPELGQTYMGSWVGYWALQPRLSTLTQAQYERYARQFPSGVAPELLRRQWLLQLGKRQDWTAFAQVYRQGPAPQLISLRCYAASDPLLSSEMDLVPPLLLWRAASPTDQACNGLAKAALATGQISQTALWEQLQRFFRQGFFQQALQFATFLPAPAARSLPRLVQNPGAWIEGRIDPASSGAETPETRELMRLALLQLAYQQPERAVAWISSSQGRELPAALRAEILYQSAWSAARQLRMEAATWYAQAYRIDPSYRPDEEVSAWMLRVALRARDWPLVERAYALMPTAQRERGEWQFWNAFAQWQQGQVDRARATFTRLASPWDYAGQLSLAALGRPLRLPSSAPDPAPQSSATLASQGDFRRAITLYRLGLYFDALAEWQHLLDSLPNSGDVRAAASAAADRQAWLLVINASTRVRNDGDWRQGFVLPFRRAILAAARDNGLDPAFVAGLIRQESGFAPGIASSAGAQGLMQVMPATAAWIKSRRPMLAAADLHSDTGNLEIGSAYLAHVLERFQGALPLAAAAYNAGPGAVARWLQRWNPQADPWSGAIFAANIPYRQTRDYVQAVLSNTAIYSALLDGKEPDPLALWQLQDSSGLEPVAATAAPQP